MPELPEVETVKNVLKKQVLGKKIKDAKVYWDNIIAYPSIYDFKNKIKDQSILDIKRRGKWLMFELNDYYLLSHLRMEGKYFIKDHKEERCKHEHILISFTDNTDLRYHDTRKFGKMYLVSKEDVYSNKPLSELGLEPWDKDLTIGYLRSKLKNKEIKVNLLDQSIIAGIGNIYADEILFLSGVDPRKKDLTDRNLEDIIKYTRETLEKAIEKGGTTIKSYTSSEGVHGRFQNDLLVHTKDVCMTCGSDIKKITIGGRTTYYCPRCQK